MGRKRADMVTNIVNIYLPNGIYVLNRATIPMGEKSRDDLDVAYNKELNELRAKYDNLFKPIYDEREKVLTTPSGDEKGTPALPKFWLTAMKNNNTLRSIIEFRDEPVLAYLSDVKAEFLEPLKQESFRIMMTFDENPYFSNKVLTKQYTMKVIDGEVEALLQGTEATEINWYPDKDVTRQTVTKIQRHKRTKETRTKTEIEDQPSFFRFFTTQEVPSNEALSRMTKQEIAELEMYVEEDYDIGIVIRLSGDSIFCASGDVADQQYLTQLLQATVRREMLDHNNDVKRCHLGPESLHNYLSRVFYSRRSKMNPLWNSAIVAGYSKGVPFVGYSDMHGTQYKDDFVVTGMGKYFAIGPLREKHDVNMSREEARELAIECMRLLFLRDCAAGDRVQIAYVTDKGVEFEGPMKLEAEWYVFYIDYFNDFRRYEKFISPTSQKAIASCQF
ncbi:Proteasome subunit beta type-4 [Babesia sp. Xinjiang]|uniref:Proteasome subunit beta type-4 n=1 Tax=Babesia sp. Xinjiang TaxID=462227 RepID=UPI000A25A2D7|nr:Proteasome subunit beta type-4 [Babesia sp. Xinjiang]ORM41309.1 Proteasome subunit beta type-4 [Babesia sp. Xinjiang]